MIARARARAGPARRILNDGDDDAIRARVCVCATREDRRVGYRDERDREASPASVLGADSTTRTSARRRVPSGGKFSSLSFVLGA